MCEDISRRAILQSVTGTLGTVAGVDLSTDHSDHSEQRDSVLPVSSEDDAALQWEDGRQRRHHGFAGGLYGTIGMGRTPSIDLTRTITE